MLHNQVGLLSMTKIQNIAFRNPFLQCVCICICMYVCMYVCMYACMCVYVCDCYGLLAAWIQIPVTSCEKVNSDLGFGGSFHQVLQFPPQLASDNIIAI